MKMVNKYSQKHKEKLRKEAHEKYQNVPEREKDKGPQKAWERCQNFTGEQKEKGVIINRKLSRSYLSKEENII